MAGFHPRKSKPSVRPVRWGEFYGSNVDGCGGDSNREGSVSSSVFPLVMPGKAEATAKITALKITSKDAVLVFETDDMTMKKTNTDALAYVFRPVRLLQTF